MPELPEVETIKNQISTLFPMKITSFKTSAVAGSILKVREFEPVGKKIVKASRVGKLLVIELEKKLVMLSHLGMSGSWRMGKEATAEKHAHIIISGKGKQLSYVDPRRFGNLYLVERGSPAFLKVMKNIGVDISSGDFTEEYCYSAIRKYPERPIKVSLLDQGLFAGCGNYIASEICAHAGVRPTRKCRNITKAEAGRIQRATGLVIGGGIASGGNTFSGGYVDSYGEAGEGVKNLVVFYQKECGLCKKSAVKKIELGGRGTYYRPACQK
ncbi:MAG: Fpg/Nei family DNA glycosylase [Bacteriovoracaceae bacterium]|jgi:formamidopyrimidine-DNA glycosylase|nr:Fpg/Nei family DNA glycosylase [Bacteriovoracaceae bacterium]